ncbi:hypothetical protein [Scopulibacillus cellulosilyticus]|uniref:Uncharacterized protein n=1 Tax=Scopulibacillus cellulosilyticus TaxID=2665665 RepID=A0ABW2PWG1_9BACL
MNNKNEDQKEFGIGLALAFILLAMFIYLNHDYLGNKDLSYIISAILISVGTIGLGTELESENKKFGFDNLGIGLGLLVIWALLHYYFPYTLINWVISFLLFFAFVGIFSGIVSLLVKLVNTRSGKSLIYKLPVIITQIGTAVLTVYQIMKKLNLL